MNDTRAQALRQWLARTRPDATGALAPVAGDASSRRYFRVATDDGASLVAMDAPPPAEDVGPFVDIGRRLAAAGVHVPAILAADHEQGLLLLDDLGTALYLDHLDGDRAEWLYGDALTALVRMQTRTSVDGLPAYDAARLDAEMALFPTWWLAQHLGLDLAAARAALAPTRAALVAAALEQPRVFVHRDYHSRNLMVTADRNPGVLDFQDAVSGPVTYDLVSLLRDCYIAWPQDRVAAWLEQYRQQVRAAGLALPGGDTLQRWFDLMGVQRHLKAIGIFARLWHRDGKARYLADIPRTWYYIERLFGRYAELDPLAEYAQQHHLGERLAQDPQAASAAQAPSGPA
jgi:aminoglycoside/choline kinase family phosphotransferase